MNFNKYTLKLKNVWPSYNNITLQIITLCYGNLNVNL